MLLNALITGLPSCWATHVLSGIPASIASMRPSRWARIVVTRIDDDHLVRRIGQQSSRQVWNILHRDGDNDKVHATNGFRDRDSGRAGFRSKIRERVRTPRVGHEDLVSQICEAAGQRAADLAG